MKTIGIAALVLALCLSCGGKEKSLTDRAEQWTDIVEPTDTEKVASPQPDTTEVVTVPRNADELFDDFIYNYASDEKLQRRRTRFPLPYIKEGKKQLIRKKEWEHDHLFTKESYYTLLYDKEEDMDLEKDVSLDSVTVEWLYLDSHERRQYHFVRDNGLWMLTSIEQHSTLKEPDEEFLEFFSRFAGDSLFQREHIAVPLKFVTPDPEDEFQILETTLELDQWFAFRPLLPTERMINIDYGQSHSKDSRLKIIDLRGIGNGFGNTLYFRRVGGEWKLSRFEDLSN